MAYFIRYRLEVDYVPVGAGPMTTAQQQKKTFFQGAPVAVPGGEAPTSANFNTAITGGMTADLEAQVLAAIAQIQGFATGGG